MNNFYQKTKTIRTIFLTVIAVMLFAACGAVVAESPDEKINKQVGVQNEIYINNQPIPQYQYSAVRDIVIQLYNLTTPNMMDTWTVMYELGIPTDVCHSRGFPIPFGLSLTSPEYMKDAGGSSGDGGVTLPQPEPSGVYTNGVTTTASWVICDYGNGGWEATYVEGNARTYSHPVVIENGSIVHQKGAPGAFIDLSRAGSATGLDPNTPDQN